LFHLPFLQELGPRLVEQSHHLETKTEKDFDMDAVGRSMKWNTVKMGKKVESFLAV
jgi:hypothetical protein